MKSLLLPLVLLSLFAGNEARADQWDKATQLTFSDAIQVPGTVLDAGTYRFKLLDSMSSRNIVQIYNGDGTRLIKTILAIPNWRLQPTGKTVLLYAERPAGQPQALQAWFYPGDNFGQQFVYPKSKASELSQLNNTAVPSYAEEETAVSNAEPAPAPTASEAQEAAAAPTGPEDVNAESGPAESAQPSEPPPVQAATTPATLPQTGSEVPLIGLVGLLLLGGALALRLLIGQKA